MRTNLPVTTVEYPITDETLIVSKTDTKGRLTYFNDQFIDAAGFTEAELMGQPHNIIRHPDMPPEAFADLWATLKAGKPFDLLKLDYARSELENTFIRLVGGADASN